MPEVSADRGLSHQRVLFEAQPRLSAASVDLHAFSRPARAFTGDFFFTHRRGERLWFALGDVAGKGLNAAVVMAMIQEELEHRITSCARTQCDPSATMVRLHEFMRPLMPDNKFATVVIGYLHDDGRVRITNGGHCPVLIVRRDGRVEQISSTGPVVGLLPVARWTSAHAQLSAGDSVVLYSDGLVEGRSSGNEEFGVDRVIEVVSRHRTRVAREIGTRLVEEFDRFTGASREDDLTVVIAKR